MKFILGISNEIKWKAKVLLLDELHSLDSQGDEMEGESGPTRSTIDELQSLDIQGDQVAIESGGTRSIIDELNSWDILGD